MKKTAKTAKRILIVDDERPIATALLLKLGHSGFFAKIASNGREALEILEKESFDLMLLDLMMPELDGFGVLKAMKKRGLTIPVIVSSNLGQEEDRAQAKALGAADYLVKADTPLLDIVEKIKHAIG